MVNALVKQDWSPEQISSRLYDEQEISISHEWIYNHIYKDKRQGGDLHKHLRYQKQRRKRYGKRILPISESLVGGGITYQRFWMIFPDTS